MGLDILYIISFTKQFANLSPKKFVSHILHTLNIRFISVGFDFSFGKNGIGKADTLKRLGNNQFDVSIITPVKNSRGQKITSTLIRKQIINGNFMDVKKYLERGYIIKAEVLFRENYVIKCVCKNPYIIPSSGEFYVRITTSNNSVPIYGIASFNNKEIVDKNTCFEIMTEKQSLFTKDHLNIEFLDE